MSRGCGARRLPGTVTRSAMLERPDPLPLTDACSIVAAACVHEHLARALRQLIELLVQGKGPARSAAALAIRRFIDARVRARRIPPAKAEGIASDIELKILVRPELFLAAENPAAYIAMSVRNRWLSQLRAEEREQRRVTRHAVQSAAPQEESEEPDPLAAEVVLRQAREDLELVAGRVVARAHEDVREQQRQTWSELVALANRQVSMDEVLEQHRPELSPTELQESPAAHSKALRDRVLQRHQRMRNRMTLVIKELASDPAHPDWTPDRAERAQMALRKLLCRCQRKSPAASSGGGR